MKQMLDDVMWEPAVMLPSQTSDRRRVARMPEMRLVAAMFDDAVQCIVGSVDARTGPRRREFLEARDWLWDDTRAWPFAFANVCDMLDLDATAVRERLEKIIGHPFGNEAPQRQQANSAALPGTGVNEGRFPSAASIEMGERPWTSKTAASQS